MFSRDQQLIEGREFRSFYDLKLHFDRLTVFPAALTLRHEMNEKTVRFIARHLNRLKQRSALSSLSQLSGSDPVIAAEVQTQKDYASRDLRFGHRFVEIYTANHSVADRGLRSPA